LLSPSVFFLNFHFLSSVSVLGFQLLSLCFFLSFFSSLPPHSGFPGSAFPLSLPALSPSLPPSFPCFFSGSSVLGFLLVSLHPSQFRSHSRSTGACLPLSPSAFSPLLPFSFDSFRFRFRLLSLLSLPFPFLPVSPDSGFPVLSSPLGSLSFPFIQPDFSCFHPVIGTWPSVCFLSLFPASLPQPFHR